MENYIFWSEIGSGFGEPGGIPPPRIARSTPPSPPGGDSNRICQKPKARAMQEIPNPVSLKYFCWWYLESWKFRIQDCLGFPYMERQGDALNPDIRRNWNSLMTFIFLFIWAALLAMKMALNQGDLNKVRLWKARGVLVYHSKSTKIQLYNSCVN